MHATKLSHEMTLAEFLASKPTVSKVFQRYTHEQRADMAASHRLGYLQRQAVGCFFWVNGRDNIAYETGKAAKIGLYRVLVAEAQATKPTSPEEANG
jgi:hypothetical protein